MGRSAFAASLSIGFSFRLGVLGGGSYGFGLIVDGHNNWRRYDTTSGGLTVGYAASGGLAGTFTTADNVEWTAGPGGQLGISGDFIGGAGGDIVIPTKNSRDKHYAGVSLSAGLGASLEWHGEATNTDLSPVIGPFPKGRSPCVTTRGYCGDMGVPVAPSPAPINPNATPTPRKAK